MKIVVLMENTVDNPKCAAEHGLSFYLETPRHHLIMDTGQSDRTWQNAAALGIDLSLVDTLVLSHGHYDHTGGTLGFHKLLSEKKKPEKAVKIYVRQEAFGEFYHKDRPIGANPAIRDLSGVRLVQEKGILRIDAELSLFAGVSGRRYWPEGNRHLFRKEGEKLLPDDFSHEQYLLVEAEDQIILLSGCAHNGILNILDRFRELYPGREPDLVLSGFHMARKGEFSEKEREDIQSTARELSHMKTFFYTGHCTGDAAFELMKPILKEHLQRMRSGDILK